MRRIFCSYLAFASGVMMIPPPLFRIRPGAFSPGAAVVSHYSIRKRKMHRPNPFFFFSRRAAGRKKELKIRARGL
jgi:hypothetical protein